jgi:hypothetical protein
MQKCCATINTWNRSNTKRDFWYACIDQSVAPGADMTMNVADYDVSITCVDSGAKQLVMMAVSVVSALIYYV